jgi:dTDP-4-dehydrorhamnose 3,5-epimerase
MSEIKVLKGEIFRDNRGQISSLNNFHFEGVRRTYIIHHPDISVIRGWHAHQHERKWFYCIKGNFSVALVKIDNWENPSKDLKPEIFHLSDAESQLVCVPAGYANCLKAHTPDAIMMVLSDVPLPEAYSDSWRYDSNLWVDWLKVDMSK